MQLILSAVNLFWIKISKVVGGCEPVFVDLLTQSQQNAGSWTNKLSEMRSHKRGGLF